MRKNVGKKKLLLTVLSALTLSLAATIGAFADESDTSKLVSGTKINGVGVGGLTPDEAKARIEGFYAGEYTLNIKEKGGKEESIKGSDIGYQVTVSGSIQNILDSQNATGRVAGPSGENTHTMEVSAQYNEEALNNKISNLSCISGGSIVTTKDASISAYEEGKEFTIVPAVQGNDVDPEKTKQVITAVVRAGSRELSLEETGCYRTVGVWESDENLKALCAAMNSRRTKQLRYVFGDASEVLSGETMASWITGSSNGQVTLDQEKVAAFVANLAATYDTAGKTRTFTGVTGAEATANTVTAETETPSDDAVCHCRHKHRTEKEEKDLLTRLNRIEGQVRGLRDMLQKDAYCTDILVQVSAVNAALNSFSKELLATHIRTCVADGIRRGNDEVIDELVTTLQKLMK